MVDTNSAGSIGRKCTFPQDFHSQLRSGISELSTSYVLSSMNLNVLSTIHNVIQERIPTQHRNVPGMLRLLTILLNEGPPPSLHPWSRIQGITLPPHHQDQPDSLPTCK